MKKKFYIALGGSVVFILLNSIALKYEFFYVPLISAVAVILYLLFFRIDMLIYLMAFVTPLSIEFDNAKYNIGLSIPAEIIMLLLTLLFFVRLLYDVRLERKIVLHPISILIYIYLAWMLITSITSQLPLVSFKFLASKIWFITACYFCVIQLIKNDFKRIIVFINCYAFSLGVVIVMTTIKSAALGFSEHGMHWIMSPYYNDHTAYGAAIAFFIPLIVALFAVNGKTIRKKLYYLLLIAILMTGLILSYCRAAWLSILIAFAVYIVIKMRIKLSWLIIGLTIVGSTLYYFSDDILYKMGRNSQDSSGKLIEHLQSMSNIKTDASNVERLNRWVAAFGMIEDRPILGWGPGTYQFEYAGYQKGKYKTIISTNFGTGGNAHSEFIGPCAEMGFPGAIIVIILMITVFIVGIKAYIRTTEKIPKTLSLFAVIALISYYIHGIMNNFLDTDKLSLPFWSAIAIIVVVDVMNKDEMM
ncbi:MAG: O-antigen ligase family protein [Bacteroidetes bacterium]|nr:O-antigen ligase family protein [Bacteroidota bacterium]MCL1968959.1 O-antigen ligase family protein [Bacteroidota bacterium]